MNLLINAMYEQAIHDYFDYMLGGINHKNEFDIKCIFKLFDSGLINSDSVYKIIDNLNQCVTAMDINGKVPDDCPIWLVKKWCKHRHKRYKNINGGIIIYE